VRYHTVAVDFMPPPIIGAGMGRIAALLAGGRISPIPLQAYPLGDAVAALRQLSAARHVGKIVVADKGAAEQRRGCSSAWVISGGLGALGALSARQLVGKGVQHVVLLGRSGVLSRAAGAAQQVEAFLTEATQGGRWAAAVTVTKCDVGRVSDVASIEAAAAGRPVAGVLHAGGVLQDAVLANQDLHHIRTAWAPKAAGAQHLMAILGRLKPVAVLKLFSSIASQLGSGGQANYAAANAMLDAMAARLHSQVREGVMGRAGALRWQASESSSGSEGRH
jgi:hypothetical protein